MKTSATNTQIKTISKETLNQQIKSSNPPQVVNVLSPEHYNLGSIKGAKKIPLEEIDQRWRELDAKREVVTFCASYECPASRKAAEKLAAYGLNVSAYEGGIKEWKAAGLPVE